MTPLKRWLTEMEIVVAKAANGCLVPVDPQGIEEIAKLKTGQGVKVTIKRMRNLGHHRKMFALLNLAYEAWEPAVQQYKGEAVAKNFESFRNDVVVLAGYGEASYNFRGEIRVRAKSMAFGSMSQDEFEKLYSAVIDVVLTRILTQYTRDDLDNVIEQVLRFT